MPSIEKNHCRRPKKGDKVNEKKSKEQREEGFGGDGNRGGSGGYGVGVGCCGGRGVDVYGVVGLRTV